MGVTFEWNFHLLEEEDAWSLREEFDRLRTTPLPVELARLQRQWKRNPDDVSESIRTDHARWIAFGQPFRLMEHLLKRRRFKLPGLGRPVRHVWIDRIIPAAILWYGLGPRRASRLPGRFGNTLLHRSDVPAALADAGAVFEPDFYPTFRSRIDRLRGPPRHLCGRLTDDDVQDLWRAFPEALALALTGDRALFAHSTTDVG